MAITADYVRQVFKGLEDGDRAEFFIRQAVPTPFRSSRPEAI